MFLDFFGYFDTFNIEAGDVYIEGIALDLKETFNIKEFDIEETWTFNIKEFNIEETFNQ